MQNEIVSEKFNYYVYYKQKNGQYRLLDRNGVTKKLDRLPSEEKFKGYEMFKGYEPTLEDLTRFMKDMRTWIYQLRKNKTFSIQYDFYYTHHCAVEGVFKQLSKGLYEHHKPITAIEYEWIEKCKNSGLMYVKLGTYNCFGYDQKKFYARLLASNKFKIPNAPGTEQTLKKLPKRKKLKYGYYHVKITCDNDNFRKIFSFSKDNVYTNTSLYQAMKYQDEYDVKIELFQEENNCYLYKDDCIESGDKVFKKWYETLNKIALEYPKNKLIKYLMSFLWGHLSATNKVYKSVYDMDNDDDTNEYKLIHYNDENENNKYYTLLLVQKPYKYNLRLKPFLTSYARNEISKTVMLSINNVVRIQTDSVTFDKEINCVDENLIAEKKTTGLMEWVHVNKSIKEKKIVEYIDEYKTDEI